METKELHHSFYSGAVSRVKQAGLCSRLPKFRTGDMFSDITGKSFISNNLANFHFRIFDLWNIGGTSR